MFTRECINTLERAMSGCVRHGIVEERNIQRTGAEDECGSVFLFKAEKGRRRRKKICDIER